MRLLGVGVFTIRSFPGNYILYWGNTYFGMFVSVTPWVDLSMSLWMDLWLTDFCHSNSVLIINLFWSPFVLQYATHSCGRSWYLSRRPLLFLLLFTFLSLVIFLLPLFFITWVCLGWYYHYEVSKYLENRSLIFLFNKF